MTKVHICLFGVHAWGLNSWLISQLRMVIQMRKCTWLMKVCRFHSLWTQEIHKCLDNFRMWHSSLKIITTHIMGITGVFLLRNSQVMLVYKLCLLLLQSLICPNLMVDRLLQQWRGRSILSLVLFSTLKWLLSSSLTTMVLIMTGWASN